MARNKGKSKKGVSKKPASKQDNSNQGSSTKETSKQEAIKQEVSQQEAPKEGSLRKRASKEVDTTNRALSANILQFLSNPPGPVRSQRGKLTRAILYPFYKILNMLQLLALAIYILVTGIWYLLKELRKNIYKACMIHSSLPTVKLD